MKIWNKGLVMVLGAASLALSGCGGAAKGGFSPFAYGGLVYDKAGNLFTVTLNGVNLRPGPTGTFVASMTLNRRIYTSKFDGNDSELWSMNADGSDAVQLTNNSADDFRPIVTPDGSTVVFISIRDGNYEIYSMNGDGSGQTRLTNNSAEDYFPAISIDGSKIVFASNRDGNYEIYSMNVNGSNQVRLTNDSAEDTTPAWTPNGNQIIFTSTRDGNPEIYRMNANGSSQTRITTTPSRQEYHASYNIDGDWIFYYEQGGVIQRMNPDGSNVQNLTGETNTGKICTWCY